jgi:hypothetical protein
VKIRKRSRLFVALLACLVAAGVAAYAFTASNTVPATAAGSGSAAISGYTVSAVSYGLNGTDFSKIDSVSFTLTPAAAGTVKVQLEPTGSWYSCTNTAGSVTCATTSPQATVAAATQLSVVSVA